MAKGQNAKKTVKKKSEKTMKEKRKEKKEKKANKGKIQIFNKYSGWNIVSGLFGSDHRYMKEAMKLVYRHIFLRVTLPNTKVQ